MYCVATVWQATGFLTLRCRFEAIREPLSQCGGFLLLHFAPQRGPCFMNGHSGRQATASNHRYPRPAILEGLWALRNNTTGLGTSLARFGMSPADRAKVASSAQQPMDELDEFLHRPKPRKSASKPAPDASIN